MNVEEFTSLYAKQSLDERIIPFQSRVGFSLVRYYPKNTPYYRDGKRIFIKIAALDKGFFCDVHMTKLQKEGDTVDYVITDGEEYKKKVTNFISNGDDFVFNESSKKIIHKLTKREFSINELVDILITNHLSNKFLKRILKKIVNIILKFLFWLSDSYYERVQTAIDIYNYKKGENPLAKNNNKNIEPFFKYFLISKNILFTTSIIFLFAIFLNNFWENNLLNKVEFSLSNPFFILFIFFILFSCEKFSVLLDKKIKEFIRPSRSIFIEKKVNFIEKLHNYQYNNKFNIRIERNKIIVFLLLCRAKLNTWLE